MFKNLKNCQTFFQKSYTILSCCRQNLRFHFLHIYIILVLVFFFFFFYSHSGGYKMAFLCDLIFMFLMSIMFMIFLCMYWPFVTFFKEMYIQIQVCKFLIELFFFLLLTWNSSFYILFIVLFANIFSVMWIVF